MPKKLDLSLFRGEDSDDEEGSIPVKVDLDQLKSRTFAHGVTTKTRRDLEKEAERKKQAEDVEATERALEEFKRSFDGPGASFSTRRQGDRSHGRNVFVRAGEARHPEFSQEPESRPMSNPSLGEQGRAVLHSDQPHRSSAPLSKPRGQRAMDAFLEEIKINQEARDARLSRQAQSEGTSVSALAAYGRDAGFMPDTSTNICITGLPASIREDELGWLFAEAGPVGTVKIMWPRYGDSYRGRDRKQLSGFVSFMRREDAERAMHKFDDYKLNGHALRLAWNLGNSAYNVRDGRDAKRSSASPHSANHQRSQRTATSARDYWFDQVTESQVEFIRDIAGRIRVQGDDFYGSLKRREKNNPNFGFLFDETHYIFRHCLDSSYVFPPTPLASFEDEGYASIYSSDSVERADVPSVKTVLGTLAKKRFEAMLRGLTGRRVEVARAMEFAIKRADAAEQVVEIICLSLCVDDTPVPRKIARLHLISDILHNSSSTLPNVWRYRQYFENRLPAVFKHFALVKERLMSYSGTLSATVFLQQVDAVLDVWDRWMVFTTDVLTQLRQLLHYQDSLESADHQRTALLSGQAGGSPPAFKSAGFKASFKPIGTERSTSSYLSDIQSASEGLPSASRTVDNFMDDASENVDGEAIDDVNCESFASNGCEVEPAGDLDGDPMLDVDGEPMSDD